MLPGLRPAGTADIVRRSRRRGGIMKKSGGIAADRLRSFLDRIERLEEEKAGLTADIREVYAEAKGTGFDTKVMRQIVRLRKMDSADRQEQEALLDVYRRAIGLE
jgi:uncharacterized protein (UPF0335 family)